NPAASNERDVSSAVQEVDLDQFITLMISELTNQDPLNPLDNNQMLQQITQIREIGASEKMTTTLEAVLTGQNLATASGLIGKAVSALTDSGNNVVGIVDRVSVAVDENGGDRTLRVHIGQEDIRLNNVREIVDVVSQGETEEISSDERLVASESNG
ncbi:MAG: flagellar hook capping FlgD N-terminal domain-containing protein, partial [Pirellulaceae bacterium]|nr:flagellar hook capping FlgD N-terminal domain-containing protein [Pirellulaceae bacterium]